MLNGSFNDKFNIYVPFVYLGSFVSHEIMLKPANRDSCTFKWYTTQKMLLNFC